jgi:hypothetical protein
VCQGEHQGDVDVDAFADEGLDSRDAGGRGWHLDHHVGAVQGGEETPRLGDGAFGIVSQRGADLQADVAVGAAGLLVDLVQQVGGAPDVVQGQGLVDFLHRTGLVHQVAQVLVIVGAAGDGFFKDRRVGGDAAQTLVNQG